MNVQGLKPSCFPKFLGSKGKMYIQLTYVYTYIGLLVSPKKLMVDSKMPRKKKVVNHPTLQCDLADLCCDSSLPGMDLQYSHCLEGPVRNLRCVVICLVQYGIMQCVYVLCICCSCICIYLCIYCILYTYLALQMIEETFRYYTYLYLPIVIIYIYMHCNYRMALHSNISLLDVKKVDFGLSTAHSAEKGCLKRQRLKKKWLQ